MYFLSSPLGYARGRTCRIMATSESISWSERMDANAPITEPIDDAAVRANLRKQANQIKDLTNRFNAVSRSEIYLSHDTVTHQGLIKNMGQWQQELEILKEQVSELCCPVVNCALHNAAVNKNQVKRPLSDISDETDNSKNQAKNSKNLNEKPFIFPPKRHTAKTTIHSNILKGPTPIINDSNIYINLDTVTDDAGSSPQIPNPLYNVKEK
ncbi:hypothetical protein AVEN_211741-1 [Araneus ventricosus]|uniref:Uncharacterized protein n=1 Tax=Araneus ventricosus TaxID=182803 RepID=A0A4Y2L915_ARAVE|nr:hypothetical protein AVEN_211741-1 [Araneus ventricosus]